MKTELDFINASEHFKAANPDFFASQELTTPGPGVANERDLQTACEKWLKMRGYWRRTEKMIMQGPPPKGYFIHYPGMRAIGNPLILDLLILGNDGKYIEVELKGPETKIEKHQARLVKDGQSAFLTRDFIEFMSKILEWEKR